MNKIRNTVARKGAWLSTIALVAAMHLGDAAFAQATPKPPERMTYQGFLAGSDGVALGNTAPKNYDVIFRIYDAESGGTAVWGEQQTVTVDKGYFSVLLGEGAAVSGTPNAGVTLSSLFNSGTASDRYVSFTVKGVGTGGADVDILPRVRLMTSPYAFLASKALSANTATTATKLVQEATGADLLSPSGTNLIVGGNLLLNAGKYIQLGADVANREGNAGQIGYQKISTNALDIVGAGTVSTNRIINFYAEGGANFTGPVGIAGNANVNGAAYVGGTLVVGPTIISQSGGVNGLVFGNTSTKQFPLNGSILYAGAAGSPTGEESLLIQGGGNTTAKRSVQMYADGGFYVYGPLKTPAGAGGVIQLGYNSPGKDGAAGTIGYQVFSSGLDLVGAGTTAANRKMTFYSEGGLQINGYTGIGGGADPNFPLHVYYIAGNGYSAYFQQFIACSAVSQFSDRRIKDVTGVSPSVQDLETLRKIRVTDYRLKDGGYKDERNHKGVIAQELRLLLPDAVSATANVIPNIQQEATALEWAEAQKTVTVRLGSGHGIKAGDRVRLKADGEIREVVAASIPDEKSFTYTGSLEAPKAIRVIGREVKDFLSVDYQQVYMTAVSALQEVDRRLQVVEQREARVSDLEKKAARVESLERDVAELRKLVADIKAASKKPTESAAASGTPSTAVVASR